jgi:hypothetical protein
MITRDGGRRTIAQRCLLLRVGAQAQALLRTTADAGADLEGRQGQLPLAVLAGPHGAWRRYATEVAEHVCNGERSWIARATPADTSWLIDDELATLLEILDRLPAALYH